MHEETGDTSFGGAQDVQAITLPNGAEIVSLPAWL